MDLMGLPPGRESRHSPLPLLVVLVTGLLDVIRYLKLSNGSWPTIEQLRQAGAGRRS